MTLNSPKIISKRYQPHKNLEKKKIKNQYLRVMVHKEVQNSHHHRSSMKKIHKKFKSKKKSKKRIERVFLGISPKKHTTLKADRKNTKKQIRDNKKEKIVGKNNVYTGSFGVSKLVVIVSLCTNVNPLKVVENLNKSIDIDTEDFVGVSDVFNIERFKQKLQYIIPKRDFLDIIDYCKVSDFVILLMSAKEDVDMFGEICLRSIQAQGISTVIPVVQHLDDLSSSKKKVDVKKSLLSFINHFFPEEQKIFTIDGLQDALNVIRMICVQIPSGIQWRDDRSYVLAENVTWKDLDDSTKGVLIIKGIVRSKPLNIDRLVCIPGWGDYQIDRIIILGLNEFNNKKKNNSMIEDVEETIIFPTENQDSLEELAPVIEDMEDMNGNANQEKKKRKSVHIDDYCYFSDDSDTIKRPRRLPYGTSDYQAAWILDSDSDASEDTSNMDVDNSSSNEHSNSESFEYNDEEDDSDNDQIDDDQSKMSIESLPEDENINDRQKEREEDRDFPDEVIVSSDVSLKKRFKKYRGLKNFRTSPWDPNEYNSDTPYYWRRIYKFGNYKTTKKRVIKQALNDGIKPGTCIIIEIRNCEKEIFSTYSSTSPFIIFSLLQYEHFLTASNFLITQNSGYELPVKSKDELILQYGPRRILVKPLFSQSSNTRSVNNVHKFERYLQKGRSSIASVVCPIFFGNIPILLLKSTLSGFSLVATGSFFNVDHSRIISKRVILTGYPFRIYKKIVIVRYMFFNSDDVEWFKPIQLFTKYGRVGYIKESLGTHGYFKAIFDRRINQQDTVAMNLYKRIYPSLGKIWRPQI
ncbi:hypothetical protein PNEG_01320 [Pneumocystis murina B123]|uniref:Bms1-type G domain-containing protein n=1 Tax=Pneumocystis murina (strain B123) TaxID=1069680 RepID=M7NTK7_PNEMU|nr:hypothetical protein PNEG_01320 [Pneumocystis murina B123]EMR10617.1 hypothetical protein PNEG_01320 [Pneumocystis murina B123]